MMRRYPAYRASGVEWLGEVPEGWSICSLKHVTLERCDGPFGSGLKSDHYKEVGTRVIRLQNLKATGFNDDDSAYVSTVYASSELLRHEVKSGDLLIAGLGDDQNLVGRSCVAPEGVEPAIVKADCFRFRLSEREADCRYVALQLNVSSPFDAGTMANGTTRSRIPLSQMAERTLALPTLLEQRAIVAFLDRETAKIDALVAEQRRLIELLKEKRQAVISHAVIRGLNPEATLKPSGIDWLGDVPEGWEIAPLKYLVTFHSGGTPSKEKLQYWEGEVPWASARDLKSEVLMDTGLHISNEAVEAGAATIEPVGSVLVLVRGMTLAKAFPVCLAGVPMAINQDLKALWPCSRVSSEYLAWLLRGTAGESLARIDEAGHGTKALRMEAWTSMEVTVPPMEEQAAICTFIDEQTSGLDALVSTAKTAITLLQERRTALISAAVTGKLDVRHHADNATEAA